MADFRLPQSAETDPKLTPEAIRTPGMIWIGVGNPPEVIAELTMDFSITLWEWYGQDEYKRVLAVCEAIPALTFLAMNADAQRNAIPYCPACEAWSETMLPLNEVLTICGAAMPSEVRTGLQQVWDLCNSLPETAFHCDDWWIFDQYEWQPLREAAEQALDLVDAVKISPYLDELILDCRNAVRGLKG